MIINRTLLYAVTAVIVVLSILLITSHQSEAAVIKDLRIGNNSEYVRLVLEFDESPTTTPTFTAKQNSLKITLNDMASDLPARPAGDYSDIVILDLTRQQGGTIVNAIFPFTPSDVKAFTLVAPHRFIIDAYRPDPLAVSSETGPNQALPGQAGTSNIRQNHFFQHMIAPLIAVTSTMLIVLVIVIWIGSRKRPSGTVSIGRLPATSDPEIEQIDAQIRELLGMKNDLSVSIQK